MIKPTRSVYITILRLSDITLPALMLYCLAVLLQKPWGDEVLLLGIGSGLLFSVLSHLYGAYDNWRGRSIAEGLTIVLKAWTVTLILVVLCMFMLKVSHTFSRVLVLSWSVSGLFMFMFERYLLRVFLKYLYSRGVNIRQVAIVGSGRSARHLEQVFTEHPQLGYKLVGYYDDFDGENGSGGMQAERLGGIGDIVATAPARTIHELFITLPLAEDEPVAGMLEALTNTTLVVKYVPDLFVTECLHATWSTIKGMPVISIFDTPMSSNMTRAMKRAEDLILTTLILLFIWPVMLLIAIGVKLSSPGPVFYRQTRIGLNGKVFTLLKFRSMVQHAEAGGALTQAKQGDWRVTAFGSFIRKTSLDELPQLLSIFIGQMSLVGPRPHPLELHEYYQNLVGRYMQRHLIKPGLSGYAQINGFRGETDTLDKMQKRVEMDIHYINNWSIWLDMKIIFLSTFKGWVHKNAY